MAPNDEHLTRLIAAIDAHDVDAAEAAMTDAFLTGSVDPSSNIATQAIERMANAVDMVGHCG